MVKQIRLRISLALGASVVAYLLAQVSWRVFALGFVACFTLMEGITMWVVKFRSRAISRETEEFRLSLSGIGLADAHVRALAGLDRPGAGLPAWLHTNSLTLWRVEGTPPHIGPYAPGRELPLQG
jgi:hypothetical protein